MRVAPFSNAKVLLVIVLGVKALENVSTTVMFGDCPPAASAGVTDVTTGGVESTAAIVLNEEDDWVAKFPAKSVKPYREMLTRAF